MGECCQVPENLVLDEYRGYPDKPDIVVRKCSICGLRHYEMNIDPIDLESVFKGMGN